MINPLISIITPCFNAEKYISQTIQSVQSQSYQNWEILIVDDGSSDGSWDLLRELEKQDSRIRAFQQKNQGPAIARNAALEKARGKYVCFLDADDLWLPHKLETQMRFMEAHDAALSFSQYRRFESSIDQTGRLIEVPKTVTYRELLPHNVIATLTTMVNVEKTGPLRMLNEPYDDFILWLSILKKGFVGYGIQQDLARYRIVPGSVSSRKFRAAKWYWHILSRVENLPLLTRLFCFAQYAFKVTAKHSRF